MTDQVSNQIFPILLKKIVNRLETSNFFYQWKEIDADNAAVGLITSWKTNENVIKPVDNIANKGVNKLSNTVGITFLSPFSIVARIYVATSIGKT